MAEAAGLALSVLGVAALFSTCVDAFNLVVSAKECSREYEELSSLLGLTRLRFEIWGESVGLPSGRSTGEPKIPYNTNLDLPHVQPDIKRALESIRQLLGSVSAIDERYGTTEESDSPETTTLRGTHIFQKSFDKLKKRIRKGQKEKSILKVARWAVHDGTQFESTIGRLDTFVDGLFKVTTTLDQVQQRYEDLRIHEEINAITKEEDLGLLADATSKHSGSSSIHRTVSDAASKRLSIVAGSIRDGDTSHETGGRPHSNASTYSFHTAKTRPSQLALQSVKEEDSIDSDDSDNSESDDESPKAPTMTSESTLASLMSARSCAECVEASLQCSVAEDAISCVNCLEDQKECSFDLTRSFTVPEVGSNSSPASLRSTPQHERLLAESAARSRAAPRVLSFEAGDAHHGDHMEAINDKDLDYWIWHGADLVIQANRGGSVAKRMFHELRTIRKAQVPFVSATPVGDDLSRIMASIEGPPETPYEGGIFWILVLASQKTPPGAPILRFHTKIYHPNIDHRTGALCADYQQKWSPAKVPSSVKGHFGESTALWSERTSPDMWSLLSLLIAICGLLASPNANDPLVPEIAQKYVEDHEDYCRAAKKWTEEYAKPSERPDESTLQFPDEPPVIVDVEQPAEIPPVEPEESLEYSSSAMQEYLRLKYDEKFDDDWMPLSGSSRSSVLARLSNLTIQSSTEPDDLDSRASNDNDEVLKTNQIMDSLLLRDAEQSHLRQVTSDLTGKSLSKIEQWRMVREVRLALEKELCRAKIATRDEYFLGLTDSRIRTLIGESANRLWDRTAASGGLQKYLIALVRSFGVLDFFRPTLAKSLENSFSRPTTPGTESTAESEQATAKVSPPDEGSSSLSVATAATSNSEDPILDEPLASTSDVATDTPDVTQLISTEDVVPSKSSVDRPRPHPRQTAVYCGYQSRSYSPSTATPFPAEPPNGPRGFYAPMPGPSPHHQPRYTSYEDAYSTSPRAFSPRYSSSAYYATTANTSRRQSSAPHHQTNRRNSYSYGASHGDAEEWKYVDYLVDDVIYRVPTHRSQKTTYNYRRHGADPYYNFEAQYAYDRDEFGASQQVTPPRRRRPSSSTPARPRTAKPTAYPKPPPTLKATEADARKHRIPPGYSLKNWDPSEEPIMLLGSVFDANSLGKWIYDWTVYHRGPATPIADMAGELWLLLIQLAGKVKRAEETMPRIRGEEDREMVDDFIESGERLEDKLKKLLRACETPMLKAGRRHSTKQLGKNAGTEFVDSIFGRDRQLEATEKFMASIRLWNLRFDANAEEILRNPGRGWPKILMTPVKIRTAFGLEDILEEKPQPIEDGPVIIGMIEDRSVCIVEETTPSNLKDDVKIEHSTPSSDLAQIEGGTIRGNSAPTNTNEAGTAASEPAPNSHSCSETETDKKGKVNAVQETPPNIQEINREQEAPRDDSGWSFGISKKDKKKMGKKAEQACKDSAPDLAPENKTDPDWDVWSVSKTDKKKGKSKDAADVWKESDLDPKEEQDEDLNWGDWGSFAKGKKKKKKKKGKVSDVEGSPMVNDQVPKLEEGGDWGGWGGWGDWGSPIKKVKEKEVAPISQPEDATPGSGEKGETDAMACG